MGWRLRLSDKSVRKLAELPIYCQRQKCSPGNVASGSIRFMQIFAGVPWRQLRVGSQKMAIFGSFGHCRPNILHTWPHDSFQVIRLSMTLGIFQGHWTVSHQISEQKRAKSTISEMVQNVYYVNCTKGPPVPTVSTHAADTYKSSEQSLPMASEEGRSISVTFFEDTRQPTLQLQ